MGHGLKAHARVMLTRSVAPLWTLCALVPIHTAVIAQSTVDLTQWTTETLAPGGSWAVLPDQAVFTESGGVNNRSVLYSDFGALNRCIKFTTRVSTTSDDDFFGFVLGFDPGEGSSTSADYLLVDWKQGTQTEPCQGTALQGLALSRVTGPGSSCPNGSSIDFWSHVGDVNEIARGLTLGSIGWQDDTSYAFSVTFTDNGVRIWVDGILELDVPVTLADGRIGFYVYSQNQPVFNQVGISDIGLCVAEEGLSLASGGTQHFLLHAGKAHIGSPYLLLGTLSGTLPGLPANGHLLPLNPDLYFFFTLMNPNSPSLVNTFGTLAADGTATASLVLPPGMNPSFAGIVAHHAYAVFDLTTTPGQPFVSFVSNAVGLSLVP